MKKYLFIIMLLVASISIPFAINRNKSQTTNNSETMRLISPYDEQEFADKEEILGYQTATTFIITKNVDIRKAIELMKPYMGYYNGNPCNEDFRIDYEVRDIAEYLKTKVINKVSVKDDLDYICSLNLSKASIWLLYARLLYPSHYFDDLIKAITGEIKEEILNKYVDNIDNYEFFLKEFYTLVSEKVSIPKIEWLYK